MVNRLEPYLEYRRLQERPASPASPGLAPLLAAFLGGLTMALMLAAGLSAEPKVQAPAPAKALQFPPRSGTHLVLLTQAVDGDTVRFFWLVEDTGRLHGINAPELHGDDEAAGRAARTFLGSKLPAKPVAAKVGREKYGRALLDVVLEDGKSLSDILVEAGHAKRWDGSGQRP